MVPSVSEGRRRRAHGAWARLAAAVLAVALFAAPARAVDGLAEVQTQRLFDAVQANDLAAVQASVAAGASLDARDRWGMSAIELAIDKGYFAIAHFLTSARQYRRQAGAPEGAPSAAPGIEPPTATPPPGGAKRAVPSAAPRPSSSQARSTAPRA